MADPGFLDDDGRDLHAALGGLLTDEPTAPWSVQDDVRRGQALRTRRRTRALGAVGVVAALALVVGVLGPRGPWATQQVVGSSPPGLDKAAVTALLESFGWEVYDVADVRAGDAGGPTVTKWSVQKDDGGLRASLGLRTWDPTSWPSSGKPAGALLDSCGSSGCGQVLFTTPDCVDGGPCWDEGITTLPSDLPGSDAGTRVLLSISERLKVGVEAAAGPVACPTCNLATTTPFLADAELRQVVRLVQQQLVGAAAPTALPSALTYVPDGDWPASVRAVLPLPVDETVAEYPVGKDADVGRLVYRVLADGLPGGIRVRLELGNGLPSAVADGPCFSDQCEVIQDWTRAVVGGVPTYSASVINQLPGGGQDTTTVVVRGQTSLVVTASSLDPKVDGADSSVDLPLAPSEVTDLALALPMPERAREFVTQEPTDVPIPDQTGAAVGSACTSDDVKLIAEIDPVPTPAGVTILRIRVIPRNADVDCTLAGTPQVTVLDPGGSVLGYRQVAGSTGPAIPLKDGVEAQFRVSRTICAAAGTDVATLRVGMPGGGARLDVSVSSLSPLVSCASASPDNDSLVSAFEASDRVVPEPTASGSPSGAGSPCTSDDVKLVSAVDTNGGATGERSLAIEVYARNPEVSCVLDGVPTVSLMSGPSTAESLRYTEGLYQQGPQRGAGVIVDAEHAGVFVVAKSRCDTSPVELVDQIVVQLPGDRMLYGVSLGAGAGLELCGGALRDTSTVWVSAFTSREGGVG